MLGSHGQPRQGGVALDDRLERLAEDGVEMNQVQIES
jgi:hypothetical protein